jgi:hypothetical protein
MTQKKSRDKNLQNVDGDLQHKAANSQQAQQIQQAKNDRRHEDAINHKD